MRFVILSAVCYNDTDNFLGFHRLYYCKCSCVYILQRATVAFVVCFFLPSWFKTRLTSGFPSGCYFRVSWMNMYPEVCVNGAQEKCVYVL